MLKLIRKEKPNNPTSFLLFLTIKTLAWMSHWKCKGGGGVALWHPPSSPLSYSFSFLFPGMLGWVTVSWLCPILFCFKYKLELLANQRNSRKLLQQWPYFLTQRIKKVELKEIDSIEDVDAFHTSNFGKWVCQKTEPIIRVPINTNSQPLSIVFWPRSESHENIKKAQQHSYITYIYISCLDFKIDLERVVLQRCMST